MDAILPIKPEVIYEIEAQMIECWLLTFLLLNKDEVLEQLKSYVVEQRAMQSLFVS